MALASSLKAKRNLAWRNKDCDRPGLETGEKPGGLAWGCWQVRCGIRGENGEDSRWGGCPPHRGVQWKEGSGVPISFPTQVRNWLGPCLAMCTTPPAPSLHHHNYKLWGVVNTCFPKRCIWWYVLVVDLYIWSSSIKLKLISRTINSPNTMVPYMQEKKYFIILLSLHFKTWSFF